MALKVFDLACEHEHLFEGWFASAEAFKSQQEQGLVRCPVCNSNTITRRVSAPHLNVSNLRAAKEAGSLRVVADDGVAEVAAPSQQQLSSLQAEMLRQVRKIIRQSDDVGVRFAQEARRMHEGEIEQRPIRGTATAQECQELIDDGISIMPVPDIMDDDRMH